MFFKGHCLKWRERIAGGVNLSKEALGSVVKTRRSLWDVREGHSRRLVQVCMRGRHEPGPPVLGSWQIMKPVANPEESTLEPAAELLQETLSLKFPLEICIGLTPPVSLC